MHTKNPNVFNNELPIVLQWYALEMSRILSSKPTANLKMHIDNLFNQASIYTVPQNGKLSQHHYFLVYKQSILTY